MKKQNREAMDFLVEALPGLGIETFGDGDNGHLKFIWRLADDQYPILMGEFDVGRKHCQINHLICPIATAVDLIARLAAEYRKEAEGGEEA